MRLPRAFGVLLVALPGSAIAADTTAAPPAAETRFMIRAFQVKGNHWLPPSRVEELVYPFMGPDRTATDVEKARAALQGEYERAGYATIAVLIPEQGVESGIIRLDVSPQVVGKVTASGTKAPAKVLARAPSLTPGAVPNFQSVQKDVVALNVAPSRKVTPEVTPGVAPGTVDVNLKVEQSSALHGSAEINNYKSPSTSDLRVAGTLRYDNLWGRGDSISVSAQTAPRRTSDGTVVSANYLAHLGRIQLLGYFVHSDSDIGVLGGVSVIGRGNLAGVRAIVPLSQSDSFYQSLTAGIDYKDFKENVLLGADRSRAPITYFPVTLGWRGDWSGKRDTSFVSLSTTFGIRGWGDGASRFAQKRDGAKPDFFVLKGEAETTRTVWKGFQGFARFTGQWTDRPLISNEEFSVGGIETVRGYDESEALGDYGVAVQLEARTPRLLAKMAFVDDLRLIAFYDYGYDYIRRPTADQPGSYRLASVGGGLRAKLATYLNGSIDIGVPLRTGPNSENGQVFARFRIWGEF